MTPRNDVTLRLAIGYFVGVIGRPTFGPSFRGYREDLASGLCYEIAHYWWIVGGIGEGHLEMNAAA
jgi:hypothetical protein